MLLKLTQNRLFYATVYSYIRTLNIANMYIAQSYINYILSDMLSLDLEKNFKVVLWLIPHMHTQAALILVLNNICVPRYSGLL